MRYIYFLLLITSYGIKPVFAQCEFRLGELAKPVRFTIVTLTPGYFEVVPKRAVAYSICGEPIEIPKGAIIDVGYDSYKGSYDGHSGIWRETLVDYDGTGPQVDTRVFVLSTSLIKLENKPEEKEIYNDVASVRIDKDGHYKPVTHSRAPDYIMIGVFLATAGFLLAIGVRSFYKKLVVNRTKFAAPVRAVHSTYYSNDQGKSTHTARSGDLNKQHETTSVSSDSSEPQEDLNTIFSDLNALIGLASVKQEVKSLANLMKVQKLKRDSGISTTMPNIHLVFTGSAGTGKTTVAQLIGRIYKQIGLLSKGQTVMVSREDLVGEFIGQTAQKTRDLIKKAIGGVLFIDEAYSLVSVDSSRDFGLEAIGVLIQAMENQRGQFAVIMAGYSKDMDTLLNSNEGLKSRMSNFIDFPDYSFDELALIFQKICRDRQHIISDSVTEKVLVELKKSKDHYQGNFGNAREVRTLVERIEKNQSNRLARIDDIDQLPKAQRAILLTTILPEDVKEEFYGGNNTKKRPIGF